MPNFDLRGIRIAKCNTEGGYDTPKSAGDAISANLELRFAEGRLYAESSLAEYLKKATGGTISIGTKYIPQDTQADMYGLQETTYTVSEKQIKALAHSGNDTPNYVGTTFYAPDMVDNVEKVTCVFVYRALFGPPSYVFQTMGESFNFQTPTTSGEFLPNNTTDKKLFEVATFDTIEEAVAWQNLMFGYTPPVTPAKMSFETPVETSTETPVETPEEAPAETPAEVSAETPVEVEA